MESQSGVGPAGVRVMHLIKSLGRGGAEMLLAEGLRFADRDRFAFEYGYFLPWKDAMVASIEAQHARVTCFGGQHNAAIGLRTRRVADYLVSRRIDVLHCHLPIAGVIGRIAGRLAGVPVVYSEHNKQERYHRLTRALNRATWTWQSRVIAVSTDVAESVARHNGSKVPISTILNGVDVCRFRPGPEGEGEVRTQFGIPADAPVVGCVAVFRQQKGLDDWIEAARRIHERHPSVRFLLVGDGPLREQVDAAVARSGLERAVHRPGLQDDVRPFLATMDVYMMTSIFEGLPVALLEAMSMECVPVCTAVGGIPEVVLSGENGVLTEPRNPVAAASAVNDLLDHADRLKSMAGRARQTVVERFSMRRMAAEIEGVYLDVLAAHPRSR